MEVVLTIWGTPRWANGGKRPNVAPSDPNSLRDFAHALADRYSGRHPGYPFVRFYTVWNEPNTGRFLSPQFDSRGRPVAPGTYAALVAAAYERRALGIASHWSFEDWGRFLPEHTTAVSMLDRLLHHATTVVTSGQSYRMRQARTRHGGEPLTK